MPEIPAHYRIVLDRICELLETKKLTQKDLCEHLGLKNKSFTEWKAGRSTSYMKKLPEIAEFLGVSVDYLWGNESDEQKSPSSEELKVALFGGDAEVTDEMWDEVMKYAEYIKSKYNKT